MTRKKKTTPKVQYQIEGGSVDSLYDSIEELIEKNDWIDEDTDFIVYEIKPVGTLKRSTESVFTEN